MDKNMSEQAKDKATERKDKIVEKLVSAIKTAKPNWLSESQFGNMLNGAQFVKASSYLDEIELGKTEQNGNRKTIQIGIEPRTRTLYAIASVQYVNGNAVDVFVA
jgi:hypothetical protein